MTIIQSICIVGFLLTALHVIFSLPVIVSAANAHYNGRDLKRANLFSGILMYACWGVLGVMQGNYLLAFAMALGMLKYSVVIIQLAITMATPVPKRS